jgi:serine protease Do
MAKLLNLPQPAGLLVIRIARDSAAERLGLRGGTVAALIDNHEVILGGDVILELNGTRITGDLRQYEQMIKVSSGTGRSKLHTCKILRGGRVFELRHNGSATSTLKND